MTRTRLIQLAFLWLIVSVMVWLTTIWRWQNQGADVGAADIVLNLLVLPLALAAVLGGSIWLVGHTRRQAQAPVVPVAQPKAAPAPGSRASARAVLASPLADAELASAVVLAEAVNLNVGGQPGEAIATVADAVVRPGLDPDLQDVDGMPVFSARHPELDLDAWLAAQGQTSGGALHEPGRWPVEAARALALLAPVLDQMVDQVMLAAGPESPGWLAWTRRSRAASRAEALPAVAEQANHLSGVARPDAPAAQLARKAQAPLLQVRVVLPPWPAEVRDRAVAWIKSRCGGLLDWAQTMDARGLAWLSEPLAQNEDIWREVDQTLLRWQREARPELLLVVAADSALSADIIERMQARGELFTAQHQTGRMPGEGAAALLLGTAHWLGLAVGEGQPEPLTEADQGAAGAEEAALGVQAAVRLWRPMLARRSKSADAHGRVSHDVLQQALAAVQSRHRLVADTLAIVSDADHRASRAAELYESAGQVWPDLDPVLAITRVGQACGDLGAAGALVPAALASAALREAPPAATPATAPVSLAVHVQASHERVLVPLSPWLRWPAAQDAPASAAT